jgi:biotin transport system substrate-specific component
VSYAPRRVVLGDLVSASAAGSVALVVGGAALIGALAQVAIPLPFTPVPLTGQTLAVLLVAGALGRWRGIAATSLYGVAGIAGVPWFAGGASGWAAASFGYIIGFVAAAALIGGLAERGWDRRPVRTLAALVLADAVILACGTVWLAGALGVGAVRAIELGVAPFVLGDLVKIAFAAGLLPSAWWLVKRLGDRG